MKITFLGTGTSQGVPVIACKCSICISEDEKDKRLRSSVLIEYRGVVLVIDTGPDFRQQMLRHSVEHIDGILLTHEHYDHIAGLDDIRAYNFLEKRAMDVYAEKRVHHSLMRVYQYVFAEKTYPGIPEMNLNEISNAEFSVKEIPVLPIRAFHLKLPVFGFRIGTMAYLTDANSIADDELVKLRDLDVLIISALREKEHISHFNLNQALEIIQRARPKRAFLTHISHLMGKTVDVNPKLPEHVMLAYDGMIVDV